MILGLIFLIISLVLILFAAEGFTNSVEAFGRKYTFSQAVVGNIFAAVGTALPETIIPLVAILVFGGDSAKEIGIGAILGAPFMLSTVAFFVVGATVTITYFMKKRPFEITIETSVLKNDIFFFAPMYALAIFVPLFTGRRFIVPLAVLMLLGYALYIIKTVKQKSAELEECEELYLFRLYKKLRALDERSDVSLIRPALSLILLQTIASLGIMIWGAHLFIEEVEFFSIKFGMSPLLFSLIIAPIATELPEKFNSVLWLLRRKDSLALGNITGAMVFQATFPVSIGMLFTNWEITGMALLSAVLAITSTLIVLACVLVRKKLSPFEMLFGGVLYCVYILSLTVFGK